MGWVIGGVFVVAWCYCAGFLLCRITATSDDRAMDIYESQQRALREGGRCREGL